MVPKHQSVQVKKWYFSAVFGYVIGLIPQNASDFTGKMMMNLWDFVPCVTQPGYD
jgi:hypothetical protein